MSKKISKQFKDKVILGISIIDSIVSGFSESIPLPLDTICSAVKQVIFYYQYLPEKHKQTANKIFQKLWGRKLTVLSTTPDEPKRIYEAKFEDKRLRDLFEIVPKTEKSILLLGQSMKELISKGLHGDSDSIKLTVKKRYGQHGLNIIDMKTTGDINYLLAEIEGKTNKEKINKFNEWANNYDSIAILISPTELLELEGKNKLESITKRILENSKKGLRNYVLINISGDFKTITKVLSLLNQLKEDRKLDYKNMNTDISKSGFYKSLRVKMNFK